MRDEYNIEKLNPRENPYADRLKKYITINIDSEAIDYFTTQSEKDGMPHLTMNVRKEIDLTQSLTSTQVKMLNSLKSRPIAQDEDCPELTTVQLAQFRRVSDSN